MGYADDYIDVAVRITDFRAKHPEGSLQPANKDEPYKIERIGDQTYIVVVAAAYRDRDDVRPGIGMAYEVFPGKTNFTRGSELQNAETSAWGRAIVAALAGDTKKSIASAEEVRNRKAEQAEKPAVRNPDRKTAPPKPAERPKPGVPIDELDRISGLCTRMDEAESLAALAIVAQEIAKLSPAPSASDLKILNGVWKERNAYLKEQ